MIKSRPDIDVNDLASLPVFVSADQQLLLGSLWQQHTVIFIFLRHFACIACRAHATEVWRDRSKYEKNGAKIVFVGNGQPQWIEKFREDIGIDKGLVLTDPTLKTFKAAGFKEGFFELIQPKSAINAAKLLLEGHRQRPYTNEAGTHWQLGGILVVNSQSKVVYHFVSEALGDFPEEPYLEVISKDEKITESTDATNIDN